MINLALAGHPNCGKTVLFNRLTGLSQKVANYPGVTVERSQGKFKFAKDRLNIVDLPGTYSLSPDSEDGRIATAEIRSYNTDFTLIVLDSTQLQKNLAMAMEVLALGKPSMLLLNMEDELLSRGGEINNSLLEQKLGIPVLSISASRGWGMKEVLIRLKNPVEHFRVSPLAEKAEKTYGEWVSTAREMAGEAIQKKIHSHKLSDKLDALLLHRYWGLPIFIIIYYLLFQAVFSWAGPVMDSIESFFATLSNWTEATVSIPWLSQLLSEVVFGGVASVMVFLPQIIILFTFIAFMEYSGYMGRSAFLMDAMTRRIGLPGKAFLPLLSSYACAIPGIMAARTIESRREQLVTIFIAPFMTCSARLPVYVILITAFIPDKTLIFGLFHYRTLTMVALYLLGLLAAILTATVLKRIWKHKESMPYIQELPPYRRPSVLSIIKYINSRVWLFVKKAGTVIFITTIALWFLASYPKEAVAAEGTSASYVGMMGRQIEPLIAPLGFDWKIGVGIITSLAAREVVISTLATLAKIDEEDETALVSSFRKQFNLPSALSLLVFFVFALQCFSTLAAARRETDGWRIPIAMFTTMLTVAIVFSYLTYNIALRLV